MAAKRIPELGAWKSLCLNDLFSMTHFIMGNPLMNTPFGVNACKLVQTNNPSTGYDVEIWARGHLKSFSMTQGQRIQRILSNPETCALILSYKKAAAERFLFSIMQTLEQPFLTRIFPEILYQRPSSQSPSWSLQNGIVVKRQSASRKEHTIDTAGLLEGMPTGGHWDDLDYDDVESLDTSRSPDITKSLIEAYEMSKNLGMPDGSTRRRVIGTFYSHSGLLSYLRDKVAHDGTPQHRLRIIPATHDGTRDGRPIFSLSICLGRS